MKALRKCACVAVQLVVTAALLFQQCPVRAIALGLEQGSDYAEIPASEEDTDAADGSPADPSTGDNSNEAASASPEKDEAASGADSAVGTDNAKQNTQSDADAANPGDDTPAPTSDEEIVWNRLGSLEWSKDANKNVILRPADGAQSGSYEGEVEASQIFGYDIKSFSIQGRVAVTSIIFSHCTEMTSANLSGLTVVGVTMRGMFMYCDSLNNVSFVGAEAPTVEDVSLLFANCSSLKNIDFEGVTFPKVKDMDWMFYGCRNLETADLKAFDSVLIDRLGLIHLFDGCSSLRAVKLPNLDSSKATSLEYMFNDCRALHEIDLTSLDTSSVVDMSSMFAGCDSLVSVSLSKKFSFGQISEASKKPSFPSGKYGRWISSVDGIAYSSRSIPSAVDSAYTLQDEKAILDCWNQVGSCVWKVASKGGALIVRPLNGSFGSIDFRSDVYPDYELWLRYKSIIKEARFVGDIKLVGNLDRRFGGCSNLCSIDFGSVDASEVTGYSGLFEDCGSLNQISLGSGFVSKPGITCGLLFPHTGASASGFWLSSSDGVCYSYDQIPAGVPATYRAVKSVDSSQWNSCGSCLWSVDESGTLEIKPTNGHSGYLSTSFRWRDVKPEKINEVKTYGAIELPESSGRMFDGLTNVVSMDLSAFDFSKCKTLEGMFFNCCSLKRINWGDPDTSSVIDMSNMFRNCSSLESIDLGLFETNQLNDVSYMFYGCSSLSNLNESSFDTSHVSKMKGFFPESSHLNSVSFGNKFKMVGKVDLPRTIITPSDTVVPIKWRDGTGSDYDYNMIPAGFNIPVSAKAALSTDYFAIDLSDVVYTGEPISKDISCVVGYDLEDICSVELKNNVNVGVASIVLTGKGLFSGEISYGFNIVKADPDRPVLKTFDAIYGQKLSNIYLPSGFEWQDPSADVGDPGVNSFECNWEGDSNHNGISGIEVKVRVTRPIEASMFSVDAEGLVYTGRAHEPAVSSEVVPEGSFSVSYRDNVAAGKAAAVVKGSGFYTGTCEVPFSIAKAKPVFKAPAGLNAVYGQRLSDVKLPDGLSWEDPSLPVGNPGDNTFKCRYAAPDDNHTGVEGIEVEVCVTRPVEASMFSVDAEGLVYTGRAHEPAVSSEVVPEGSFSVSYRDNVAAGKAAAVVKGSGFYTGTCEVPFSIAKAKPSYTVPATLKGVYGKKLSDVKLPEGFSWSDPSMRIDWYGSKSIEATFTPSDTKNYEVLKGIEVSVFVGRNVIAVPTIKDLVYSGSAQAPSVSFDGIHVVNNAGGVNVGEYSVEIALDDPNLDCWKDGTTENKKVEYRILPADINSADIAPISPCLLKDGRAEPGVSVTFGGQELSVDKDFDVSYFDNGKVGTASVTIKGKGNFTGEKTVYFQIAKGDLGECLVTTKRNVYLYKGSAIQPRVFVSTKDGGAVLREGVDYKVTYANNYALGTGHATINGMGDYIGSSSVDFAIVDTIDLSTYCTAHAYDAFYTGGEVCPRVDVRLNTESYDEAYGNGGASRSEDAPIEGQDYTVSYEDNVEPGMATAVVRGRGRYTGEVRVQFHILRKSDFDLSDCSVRLDPPSGADRYSYALKGGEYSFLYTGSAVEPDVSVSLYGGSGIYVELRAGVDYELDYRSNTEPGSATVAVRGINGLSGSQSLGFNVVRKLSVADLLLTKYDFEQSVYQLKPGFALAPKLKASSSFIEGADYTLSYSNCDKAGNGLVTVTGIGRYAGNVVIEVPIVESLDRSLLSDCSFDKIEDQVYTGSEIYPSVVLRNASGAEVDQARECSLHYSNNVNVGKATVTASEGASSSSYIGETSTNFNILPADIEDAYFAPIGDGIYTGNAIKPDVLVRFNGKMLVKGIDYDLTYSDNIEVGTAQVVVTGKGNFGGKREMTFNIVRPVIEFDQDMVEGKTVSTSWTKKVNVTSYRMVLNRGGMVRIRTSFSRIDSVLCSIQNENGDIIQSWAPSDGGDYGFFALPAGTYYFQYIGSPKFYGGFVYASYSMTPFGEPADTIYEVEDNNGTGDGHTIDGDATPIEIGRCFAGSNYYAITDGYGDLDYFKFTVTKRGHYSMSLFTNARLMFALTDAQGNILDNRDTGSGIVAQSYSGSLTGLDFGTLEPGTYYVLVLSKGADAIGAAYFGCVFDSSDPAPTKKGVGRVSGNTRYDTMGSLTERGNWAKGGSVVLASGANYPDALAASSLAGGFNGPILLTDPNGLSTSARDQLKLLCPSKVFIVGGNAAVSPSVERQVKELLGSGCAVFRVAGQTRYETSLVAAEINPKSSDTVIVATGGNYADALSVSPYAFASGSPVVLCDKSSGLTAGAMGTIRSKKYSKAVIVGGTAAVPAAVERQLRSAGVKNITRLSGATRYETSTKIAEFELSSGLGFTMDGVLLATGANFPDALSAGPLAGRSHSPLLLVDPGASYVSSYLSKFRGTVRVALATHW